MKRADHIKEFKKLKDDALTLAVHKSRTDADGDPLMRAFPKLNFKKTYGKYGWKEVSLTSKAPKEVTDAGEAKKVVDTEENND